MIRLTHGPGEGRSKYVPTRVEINGVDISSRVTAVTFRHDGTGVASITLDMPIYGDDVIDMEAPDSELRIVATDLRRGEPFTIGPLRLAEGD